MIGLENNIKLYAEEFLKNSAYFIVDIVRGTSNKKIKISVFLDSDNSVSIKRCAELSRYVTNKVDEEMNFEDPYTIEVSSAGLDRPLKLKRQFVKNIGRKVDVVLNDGQKITGKIEKVGDNDFTISTIKTKKTPSQEVVIENNSMKSTIIKVSF